MRSYLEDHDEPPRIPGVFLIGGGVTAWRRLICIRSSSAQLVFGQCRSTTRIAQHPQCPLHYFHLTRTNTPPECCYRPPPCPCPTTMPAIRLTPSLSCPLADPSVWPSSANFLFPSSRHCPTICVTTLTRVPSSSVQSPPFWVGSSSTLLPRACFYAYSSWTNCHLG